MRELSIVEMEETKGGEIAIATIMALMAIGLVTVIAYKLFRSHTAKTTIPGGFSFSWTL